VGSLLLAMQKEAIPISIFFCKDAVDVLKNDIPDHSLETIQISFRSLAKARHHKRRLIQTEFVKLLHQKLKPNGLLHIVTDWENYADHNFGNCK